ncbi:MAG: iron-containing alcohol dehydrogenase family protein [Lachnospiraceae bacterium]|nr:iron-containing alcohol dehydrogenase family protein [Lachnospiraceae bacterium]
MVCINTPEEYISEPGAINKVAEYVSRAVEQNKRKVLIIWSKTPRALLNTVIAEQLFSAGIEFEEVVFEDFPTEKKARECAEAAIHYQAAVIIGLGGGRVMDVTKAAGTFSKLPVITIPTVASTCAAWAAVSIIYTDKGDFDQFLFNKKSARFIIADTNIIANAPVRYLKSGIVDTMAKWYEPVYRETCSFTMNISQYTAKLAFDYLNAHGVEVIENIQNGIIDENTVQTIDCIIYLAGNIGSFVGKEAFSGKAHPFYHSSRRFRSTYVRYHGEIVAFALVAQGIYEGRSQEEIDERLDIFEKFDNTYTLEELGLSGKEQIITIAERIQSQFEGSEVNNLETVRLVEAFEKVDRLVKDRRT